MEKTANDGRAVPRPTKQQWDEIAERLDRLLMPVYLLCDGYLVSAVLTRTTKNRLEIVVAVNGWEFKGEWLPGFGKGAKPMAEEARRFWFPRQRSKYSAKDLRRLERVWGKRECRKLGYYDKVVIPMPIWRRPGSFIRHLRKQNESIEIIDHGTYSRELERMRDEQRAEESE